MPVEQYSNFAQDTLNGGIDNVVLSLDLNDASEFPATGNFRLNIEDELLLCTARTGNTLTVVRGQEGTVAASHSSGATVTLVATAGSVLAVGSAIHRTDAFASRPAAGVEGRLFLPTDGPHLFREDGSVWSAWGPNLPMVPPVDGDFAWVNQGAATVDATRGGIVLTAPAVSGDNVRARLKTIPTAPYIVTMACIPTVLYANFLQCGMALRESGTGELVTFCLISNSLVLSNLQFIASSKWNSATSFSADYTTIPTQFLAAPFAFGPCLWFQIEDDNVNRILRVSADGVSFQQVHSVGRTDFLTPDQIGFYAATNNATHTVSINVISWKEE